MISEKSFDRINYVYKLNTSKTYFSDYTFMDNYIYAFVLLLLMGFCILYWYIHVEMLRNKASWESIKCDPKLLYISGYINPEPNMNSYDSTIYNYNDCITRGYKDVIDHMKRERSDAHKANIDYLSSENNKDSKTSSKIFQQQKQNENIINDLSLNITDEEVLVYNQIQNIGIYMDQLDRVIDYVSTYTKNYLSYLYLTHLKNKEETKASKVKTILDEHFDGPSFA